VDELLIEIKIAFCEEDEIKIAFVKRMKLKLLL
jgi:hypothetical protein